MPMTSHHAPNAKTANDPLPQVVLFVLRHDAASQPSLDRLQNLLFLVDREHARAFAVVLTFLLWVREPPGPWSDALLPVLAELDRAGQLPPGLLPRNHKSRRIAESQAVYAPDTPGHFSPRAARSLQRVLWRYANVPDDRLREEIESTHSYQDTPVGEQIDLSGERAWLVEKVSQQGTDQREWGDPAKSAAEDEEIMEIMDRWRSLGRRQRLGR
jgi:hypothetical protein